jgi:glycogen debranching enzyme
MSEDGQPEQFAETGGQAPKGKAEEAVGVFDTILAGLASGASGPQGQIGPDGEVDERSREGETMAIRELRLRALLSTTRYADTLRELDKG